MNLFPGKTASPVSKMWKTTPTLNISHIGSYGAYLSTKLAISGATNPGVPHLGNIYGSSYLKAASPKSTTLRHL